MKQGYKVFVKLPVKTEKEREAYRKREERPIEGNPKIILGKAEPNS